MMLLLQPRIGDIHIIEFSTIKAHYAFCEKKFSKNEIFNLIKSSATVGNFCKACYVGCQSEYELEREIFVGKDKYSKFRDRYIDIQNKHIDTPSKYWFLEDRYSDHLTAIHYKLLTRK
jgi:hypothetical protein